MSDKIYKDLENLKDRVRKNGGGNASQCRQLAQYNQIINYLENGEDSYMERLD